MSEGCPAEQAAVASRWAATIQQEAGGDPEIEAGIRNAWKHRAEWPSRFLDHAASLCLTDQRTFDDVASFLDAASGE